jgi:hypothetical protein
MAINDALARGNAPHSSASDSELVHGLTRKFEQELSRMVERVGAEQFTPATFRGLVNGLSALLAGVGREALSRIVEDRDVPRASVEFAGQRLRYRGQAQREWLTQFGKITVSRRIYRADGAGAPRSVPLDEACGMVGRYLTPDVEEMAAVGAAMLTAVEVEQLLGKVLPEAPSATSVQKLVCRIGTEIELRRADIEDAIWKQTPLDAEGDVLVASWDGVMTPMREGNVAWREAGVATLSVYRDEDEGPHKSDTRFLARMPESGMTTLVASLAEQAARAIEAGQYRDFAVICDGKESIWTTAARHPVLRDATHVLDFFHAAENLMKAAKAIFGDNDRATQWYERHRERMVLDKAGAANARRSMLRYAKDLPEGSDRRRTVENAAKYFYTHRDRMLYADFIERGIPIGSGPVESAAKNLVQARLKRSGMHWTKSGGQHVLDLRAYLKSERWGPMWSTLQEAA